jgi:hypothetical protein
LALAEGEPAEARLLEAMGVQAVVVATSSGRMDPARPL